MINFTIILADDEQQILYGMKNGIDWESLGFSVVGTAQNGKEALELIEEYHPDLLISDIKMPFMDGLELSKTIHENYINTKIILFSGWDDFEYARTAISYGVSQYIMKPIDYNEMQKLLTTMHEELEKEYAEKMNRTRLENIYTESIPLLRQQFFTQLLTETLTEDYCTLQMKNLKLNLDYEVFHIITVKIRENDLNDVLSELSIKETIKESLAIVLDTANAERTDDQRFSQAKMVIKIDHHPNRAPFGYMCVVFDTAAAACEILAQFFWDNSEVYSVSRETAEYLYKGFLTDTLCFRTTNTNSHTLYVASYLATKDIDIPALNRELFDTDLKIFQFGAYLRSHVVITDAGLAYCIVTKEELVKNAIRAGDARNCIDELGHVKQFKAWAVFTQHENGEEVYDASIRSKETAINTVAEKYGGGGHKNASGIKNIPADKLETLILDLKKEISK